MDAGSGFRAYRRIYLALGTVVPVVILTVVQLEWRDGPRLSLDSNVIWALRVGLAVWSLVGVATAEWAANRAQPGPDGAGPGWLSAFAPESRPLVAAGMIRAASAAAVAVYGMLIFLGGGSVVDGLAFGSAAMALWVWRFPRRSVWERSAPGVGA